MRPVTMVIKPFKLEDVREALSSIPAFRGWPSLKLRDLAARKAMQNSIAEPSTA